MTARAAGQAELGRAVRHSSTSSAVFDWSHGHTMPRPRPCRRCGGSTSLCDDARRPSHKVCAELAAARKAVSR